MDEGAITGPYPLMEELSVLRQRKSELEQQLNGLQESRKQLMVQLESLMKMIKVFEIQFHIISFMAPYSLFLFFLPLPNRYSRISSYRHAPRHPLRRPRAEGKARQSSMNLTNPSSFLLWKILIAILTLVVSIGVKI